jgi:hypothetical protein
MSIRIVVARMSGSSRRRTGLGYGDCSFSRPTPHCDNAGSYTEGGEYQRPKSNNQEDKQKLFQFENVI